MYSKEIITKAKELFDNKHNISEISRLLNVNRSTIQGWKKRNFELKTSSSKEDTLDFFFKSLDSSQEYRDAYYYILGQYLGDGCISNIPKKQYKRLRIFAANKYSGIKEELIKSYAIVYPNNSVMRIDKQGCEELSINKLGLEEMFPQYGSGKKHDRKIELTDWQLKYIQYIPLIKGLFHSDGSLYFPKQNKDTTLYDNGVYSFTNVSEDITKIYQNALTNLNIKFTCRIRRKQRENDHPTFITMVNIRESVQKLYSHIGEKY